MREVIDKDGFKKPYPLFFDEKDKKNALAVLHLFIPHLKLSYIKINPLTEDYWEIGFYSLSQASRFEKNYPHLEYIKLPVSENLMDNVNPRYKYTLSLTQFSYMITDENEVVDITFKIPPPNFSSYD